MTMSQHPDDGSVDVSIVLPVFNEAGHLDDEIERIRKTMDDSRYSYEILVVDDGSTDGSSQRLRDIKGIRLLQFTTNRGSGSARKYGTQTSRGRIVVWTDVDMTYPNDTIPELLGELDGYDQVVGARTTEEGTLKLLRMPAKWMIRRLASYLTGVRIPDLNSGFRAFRRDVALQFLHLLPKGFSCVTTITMAFLSNGYSVKYVPIDYAPRAGESKFHWWKDTKRYLLQVLRLTLMWEPMRVFGPPAAILVLTGVGKLIYDLIDKDFRVATNTVVVLGVAFALALIGMIADLMVQLNKRPQDAMPSTVE
jgi:glycosyltransferase involved in cell wall biosynthesis